MDKIKALYIHIPFCDHICIYCDFYKMISTESTKIKYVDYLIKELELKKNLLLDIETVYIGGGTPSALSLELLEKLFIAIKEFIPVIKEYTIELNPLDVIKNEKETNYLINLLQKYNLNRISLGIQSFNNDKLTFLRRNHTEEIALKSIDILKSHNFNISCDIIYGVNIPNEFSIVQKDLDTLISKNVNHISTYSLTLEEKTILYKQFKENKYLLFDPEIESEIYYYIKKTLKNYNHYEVSNFCLEGYESKHNLTYWNNEYYLGIGVNSSYYYNNTRYKNVSNLNKYFQGIDNKNLEHEENFSLNKQETMDNEIMLGFRKIQGINKNDFYRKFGLSIYKVYDNINKLVEENYLIDTDDYIKINESYLYVMNQILLKLI